MTGPGADTRKLLEMAAGSLWPNYRQQPVVFTRGEGSRLWDTDGREYVDFVAGIATCNLGHCHPAVTKAIQGQAARLLHVSNWYYNDIMARLAAKLTSLTSMNRVFFCNSGAEASEAAIKLARKRAFEKYGPGRNLIVSFHGAFHGRTMKALTATDPKHHDKAFSPYPGGFEHIRHGDLEAMAGHLPSACALFLEPVQGEGGVNVMDQTFLRKAAALCRQHDVLLMADEVQTGMGRCGTLFAHQAMGFVPDVMTLAKGLANGFPMGAVLAGEEIASVMGPGTHGSTFGGSALACAAALATLETLQSEGLPQRAALSGEQLRAGLQDLARRHDIVIEVRGMGLLLGMELTVPAAPLVGSLMTKGYLVTAVGERTLRFTPPLNIAGEDILGMLNALDLVLGEYGG
ncbi:MAG: aspartate aminotransferase family protein [bacterium]|nr:aspartate aminotransferase family protein [bacterium]MDT8395376.1 aspartate aminotransferase family protein [bacterium]